MALVLKRISQFYLHTPRSSANGMNHTCLSLPSQSWYSFTDPGGMEGWVGLGGWFEKHLQLTSTFYIGRWAIDPQLVW